MERQRYITEARAQSPTCTCGPPKRVLDDATKDRGGSKILHDAIILDMVVMRRTRYPIDKGMRTWELKNKQTDFQ